MTQQLSLFPNSTVNTPNRQRDEKLADLEAALNPVDEVFTASSRLRDSHNFLELLDFIARFPNYSAFNGFLLFIQNSSATQVATARTWAQKFGRYPLNNARPLALLAPMAPIRFVFDIRDTEGSPIPSNQLNPVEIRNQLPGGIYANTLHNCTLHGIVVYETTPDHDTTGVVNRITPALRKKYKDLNIQKDTSYLIQLDKTHDLEEKYSSLVHELGHIFCSHLGIDRHAWWTERDDLNISCEEIEAGSVAYLVCKRKGLMACSQKYLSNYAGMNQEMPPFSLNAVLQAVTYVEEMGKHRWKEPGKHRRN